MNVKNVETLAVEIYRECLKTLTHGKKRFRGLTCGKPQQKKRKEVVKMERKYRMTEETLTLNGITLHRIEAVRSFGEVKVGDKGGWIEREKNLSHDGGAWVGENAKVYENARIQGNAEVFGDAEVHGFAIVLDNAMVSGNAKISGNAEVFGDAWVHGYARLRDKVKVYGNAEVFENALLCNKVKVSGNTLVYGYTKMC